MINIKKTISLVIILSTLVACTSSRNSYIKDLGLTSNNDFSLEDVETNKKSLEDIIVFNEKGVTIRREGNNLILSMPELVLFDFDKFIIKDKIKPSLTTLARALHNNRDIRIKIDGYTDFIGSESYNLDLSVKRAKTIKNFLVSKGAISNNISIEGYGERNPISTNSSEQSRARNRRVEFIISRG